MAPVGIGEYGRPELDVRLGVKGVLGGGARDAELRLALRPGGGPEALNVPEGNPSPTPDPGLGVLGTDGCGLKGEGAVVEENIPVTGVLV